MAYRTDLANSAKRHLRAAQELHVLTTAESQPGCAAVAGYLFGLAGELALKQIMRQSGIPPLAPEERRDDPYYAHFPELKTQLKNTARGRRAGELRQFSESSSLFQYWDTDMRYAPTTDVRSEWVDSWRRDAEQLVAAMDLP